MAAAIVIIANTTIGLARDKAPASPPQTVTLGQVIDRQVPAAIPKFVAQRSVPAGLAEREWVIRNTYPSFGFFSYGCSFYGWGFGNFGSFGGGTFAGPGASIETGDSIP